MSDSKNALDPVARAAAHQAANKAYTAGAPVSQQIDAAICAYLAGVKPPFETVDETYNPVLDSDAAMKIVADFCAWTHETGKCPIGINDKPWFKRLCALAERCATAERLARAGQSVPSGFWLAPIEPTREMWAAMGNALVGYKQRHHDKVAEELWTAVRAAAPPPPPSGQTFADGVASGIEMAADEASRWRAGDHAIGARIAVAIRALSPPPAHKSEP